MTTCRWNGPSAAARCSSEMVRLVIRPPCVSPHRTSPQTTTAPFTVIGIAAASQIEVTSLSSPGRLSRPAE